MSSKLNVNVTDEHIQVGEMYYRRDPIAEIATKMLSIYDWVAISGREYWYWLHGTLFKLWYSDYGLWFVSIRHPRDRRECVDMADDFEVMLAYCDQRIDQLVAKHEPRNARRSQNATKTLSN